MLKVSLVFFSSFCYCVDCECGSCIFQLVDLSSGVWADFSSAELEWTNTGYR